MIEKLRPGSHGTGSELVEKPIPVIPRSEATWESVILMLQIYIKN